MRRTTKTDRRRFSDTFRDIVLRHFPEAKANPYGLIGERYLQTPYGPARVGYVAHDIPWVYMQLGNYNPEFGELVDPDVVIATLRAGGKYLFPSHFSPVGKCNLHAEDGSWESLQAVLTTLDTILKTLSQPATKG